MNTIEINGQVLYPVPSLSIFSCSGCANRTRMQIATARVACKDFPPCGRNPGEMQQLVFVSSEGMPEYLAARLTCKRSM